ncbi:beta-lactamase domain-containing protein 2-like [Antedon mediterranea]|uniref:beta-lactamase domain-containing protein 2-like n=1 Tax=Antedon mediterranea TaxID=105859 RepID=UPI003AF5A236
MSILKQALVVAVTAIAVLYLPGLWKEKLPVIFDGRVEPGFERVFEAFKEHYRNGIEPSDGGSAFAAYHKGKKVVDIWGGYADKEAHRPWKPDILHNIYSSGKGVAAIAVAMLVDRGLLKYSDKVVKYWPEFGKHGKQDVTVETLLSHQAGIPFPNESLSWDLFRDHDRLADVLADSVPQWEIGTGHGYHALTMASFCGVLLRKVDPKHRTLGQFVHDELEVPFGIDIHFGLRKELFYRATRMEEDKYTTSQMLSVIINNPLMRSYIFKSLFGGSDTLYDKMLKNTEQLLMNPYKLNDPENRIVEVPSAFGVGTAEALAKLYSILVNGGELNGKRIMSEKAVKQLNTVVTKGMDKVVMIDVELGHGVIISKTPIGKAFGHSGVGGQEGFGNLELKLGYGYVTNTPTISLTEDGERYLLLRDILYDCVRKLGEK